MASTVFNAYPRSGTAWHERKIVYGIVDAEAGSSISWWIGLDRETFSAKAREAEGWRRRRWRPTDTNIGPWTDLCD